MSDYEALRLQDGVWEQTRHLVVTRMPTNHFI